MGIAKEAKLEAYYESRETAHTRMDQIYQRLRDYGPMTADTLRASMGLMDPNNVRPRLTELRDAGLVREAAKVKNRRGKSVTLWEAVVPNESICRHR